MAPPIDRRKGGGRNAAPDPRTIRRALGVLERLPHEALADLAERLIDRLDASEPDPDLEAESDACPAEDVLIPGHHGPGDATDAEENGDEEEEDAEAEREPVVTIHRRKHVFVMVTSKGGKPVRVQTVVGERRG